MGNEGFVQTFDGPATYQITVQGKVEEAFLKCINNMSVTHNQSHNEPISTLTGELIDQSALNGLLNTLFDYQFSVISVLKI